MIAGTDSPSAIDDWRDDIPVPDVSNLITEDDRPVDNQFSEKQMRLLVESLHASWKPGVPFVAMANVGVFVALNRPAIVPDVLVTTGVSPPKDIKPKDQGSHFTWIYDGKSPEIVIEIVSNKKGGELGRKLQEYAHIHVRWYAVFDPCHHIQDEKLVVYSLGSQGYERMDGASFPLGLNLVLWDGEFEGYRDTWLRWTDGDGHLLLTGEEGREIQPQRADSEKQRADGETQRAEGEKRRADMLAAKLKELGIDL